MLTGDRVVLKVGGSLIEHAERIIRVIRDLCPDILIIPGGGVFADAVRQRDMSGSAAHFMAIAAMDQYGWLLSDFGIQTTTEPAFYGSPRILLPYTHLLKTDPLPHSWDVTSDTISAWYAHILSAPLVVLKSIDYIRTKDGAVPSLQPGMVTEDLDPAFMAFVFSHAIQGIIINGSDPARLACLLKGGMVPGTMVDGTI